MSSLDWSLQQAGGSTAFIAANSSVIPLARQIVWNTQTGMYAIGDGSTQLGSLTFYGGVPSAYTAGTGLQLTGQQFSIDSTVATLTGAQAFTNKTGNISMWTNNSGYITSAALAPYLTSANAALTYQPIGSYQSTLVSGTNIKTVNGSTLLGSGNLAVGDALVSNPLSQFAATTSAQLAGIVSDETGTGVLVFGTSPTFTNTANSANGITISNTTNASGVYSGVIFVADAITSGQSVIGVTASSNTYVGASRSMWYSQKPITFFTDANVGIEFYTDAGLRGQITGTGLVNLGNATVTNQRIVRFGQDTAFVDIGSYVGGTSNWAIYGNQGTPSSTNYFLMGSNVATNLNATTSFNLQIGTTNVVTSILTATTFSPFAAGSGAATAWTFTVPASTGQTTTSNIPNFKVTGSNKTWANGTVPLQYFNWFTSNTTNGTSGSNSFTAVGNLVVDYVQGGSFAINVTSAAIYVPTLALTNTTNAYGMIINMPSGATNNHGLQIANGSILNSGIVLTSMVGSPTYGALYMGVAPGATNYTLASNGTSTFLNGQAGQSVVIAVGTNGVATASDRLFTVSTAAITSGAQSTFIVTSPANTGQNTTANIPNFKVNGSSKTWANGTVGLQYFNWFTSNTTNGTSGSNNFTTVGNLIVEYVQGGSFATNVTSAAIYIPTLALTNTTTAYGMFINVSTGATNNYALGMSGNINMTTTNSYIFASAGNLRLNAAASVILENSGGTIFLNAQTGGIAISKSNNAATARLHILGSTASAGTAPLKIDPGTNMTSAESGAMEYNNTFHLTNSDATRRHVVLAPNTTKVTAAAPYANDGYVVMNIGGTDFKVMTTA